MVRSIGSQAVIRRSGELVTIVKVIQVYGSGNVLYEVKWASGRTWRMREDEMR